MGRHNSAIFTPLIGNLLSALSLLAHAQVSEPAADPQGAATGNQTTPGQTTPEQPQIRIETGIPEGFEDLSEDVSTLFDLFVLGRRIGSFRATLVNGSIRFDEPALVADALSELLARQTVLNLLAEPLPNNEQYRCLPGQTFNCGLLPAGQTGAIVDPQRFSVELFFDPASFVEPSADVMALGESSSSGPTLVQNIAVAGSVTGGESAQLSYGVSLDTYASIGRTAFIGQTLIRDEGGSNINQALLQHVWGERIVRAGLFEDFSSRLLTNYRLVGVEFGSFYPRMANNLDTASPIQIVLPRAADVEIRRNGILLSVRTYAAGPQMLDTSGLPNGSYPISIIARAEGAIILEETRSFSRAGLLPTPGKTEFSVRAGVFAENRFGGGLVNGQIENTFFPPLDGDLLVGAFASRRVAPATGVSLGLLSVGGKNYAEGSVSTALGGMEAQVVATVGDEGSYGFLVNGSTVIRNIRFTLSGRWVEPGQDIIGPPLDRGEYAPFFRAERNILGSMQFNLLGGSVAVLGAYNESDFSTNRYSVDVRYARPMKIFNAPAIVTGFGRTSTEEVRFGASLTAYFGVGPKTRGSVTGGVENVSRGAGNLRQGVSPIVNAVLTHRETMPGLDLTGRAGMSTDANNERAFIGANVASSLGVADLTAQYTRSRGGFDATTVFGNLQTGFAIGGGTAKFGLAQPGDAMILADLALDRKDETPLGDAKQSGYRVRVNTQSYNVLQPGQVLAVGLGAYDRYSVSLIPENAPPYEVDFRRQEITLYPGNVVRLSYAALRSFTLFGQLLETDGTALKGGIIRSTEDLTQVSEDGYFTISAPAGSSLSITTPDGRSCKAIPTDSLVDSDTYAEVYRVGTISCRTD